MMHEHIEPNTCRACQNQMFCKYKKEFERVQSEFAKDMAAYKIDYNPLSPTKLIDVPYLVIPELTCRYYRERHAIAREVDISDEEMLL